VSIAVVFKGNNEKEKPRRRAGKCVELLALSLALALNGIAEAFGAGLAGLGAVPLALSVTLLGILSVGLGGFFGKKLRKAGAGRWLNVMSGLLLIGVGVYQFLS